MFVCICRIMTKLSGGRHLDCTSHAEKCAEAKKLLEDYTSKYSLWPSNVNRLNAEMNMSTNKNTLAFIDELYQRSLEDRK